MFSHPNNKQHMKRQRFTLIELIVVLIVLVGLGTILVPRIPGMVARTHLATGGQNMPAIAKAVQQYEALNFATPDNYDSLLVDDGSALFTKLPGAGAGLAVTALDADTVASLNAAGITTLKNSDESVESATFDNVGADQSVSGTNNIATLDDPAELGLDASRTYAVFGIGTSSDLIGNAITQAPVHFPDDLDGSPNTVYSRFGVVYDISGEKAKFVMSVAFHGDGPDGLEHLNEEFWEVVESDSAE